MSTTQRAICDLLWILLAVLCCLALVLISVRVVMKWNGLCRPHPVGIAAPLAGLGMSMTTATGMLSGTVPRAMATDHPLSRSRPPGPPSPRGPR